MVWNLAPQSRPAAPLARHMACGTEQVPETQGSRLEFRQHSNASAPQRSSVLAKANTKPVTTPAHWRHRQEQLTAIAPTLIAATVPNGRFVGRESHRLPRRRRGTGTATVSDNREHLLPTVDTDDGLEGPELLSLYMVAGFARSRRYRSFTRVWSMMPVSQRFSVASPSPVTRAKAARVIP